MGSQNPHSNGRPHEAARPQTPYDACYGTPGARPQTPGADRRGAARPQQPGPAAGPSAPGPSPTPPGMSEEDFEQLCRQISETVDQVSQAVGRGLGQAGSALGGVISRAAERQRQAAAAREAAAPPPGAQGAARASVPGAAPAQGSPAASTSAPWAAASTALSARAAERQQLAQLKTRFKSPVGLTAAGAALTFLGAYGVVSLGLGDVFFTLGSIAAGETGWLPASLAMGAGAALCVWPLAAGIRRLGTARLAQAFRRAFSQREVCTFKELAVQAQVSEKRALAASRRMLRHGLLPQGHIDDEGTCLMVTDDVYRQYRAAQAAYPERCLAQSAAEDEARRQRAQREADDALPADARAVIDEGTRSLARIAELNDAIADAAVSAKIAAIEDVVARILDRVRDEPECASALDRLAGYYLPTTIRLLEAYDDLEEQPVQGEHISRSRHQIERTLDTLRGAYEKLLDETFRSVAMDVSADISVLHAVLAQEGLTESPFDQTPGAPRPAQDA